MGFNEWLDQRVNGHHHTHTDRQADDSQYPQEVYDPYYVQEEGPSCMLDVRTVRGIMGGWLGNVGGAPDEIVLSRVEPTMPDGDNYHPQKSGRYVASYY
jgi:hypothetical protein